MAKVEIIKKAKIKKINIIRRVLSDIDKIFNYQFSIIKQLSIINFQFQNFKIILLKIY